MWTFFVIFIWVAWFWVLISIMIDVFRRHDIGGGMKALWLILLVFLPIIGVLAYAVSQNDGMAERQREAAERQYGGRVMASADGGGAAAEIERAKKLLDSGTIDEAEFAQLK